MKIGQSIGNGNGTAERTSKAGLKLKKKMEGARSLFEVNQGYIPRTGRILNRKMRRAPRSLSQGSEMIRDNKGSDNSYIPRTSDGLIDAAEQFKEMAKRSLPRSLLQDSNLQYSELGKALVAKPFNKRKRKKPKEEQIPLDYKEKKYKPWMRGDSDS